MKLLNIRSNQAGGFSQQFVSGEIPDYLLEESMTEHNDKSRKQYILQCNFFDSLKGHKSEYGPVKFR